MPSEDTNLNYEALLLECIHLCANEKLELLKSNPELYHSYQEDVRNKKSDLAKFIWNILEIDNLFLVKCFEKDYSETDLQELSILIDAIREEGYFYCDSYTVERVRLFELMLRKAYQLANSDLVIKNSLSLWICSQVYDIILHQIRFEELPESALITFYDLTEALMNPELIILEENQDFKEAYWACLYFIEFMKEVFKAKKDRYSILVILVNHQIKKGSNYRWLEAW